MQPLACLSSLLPALQIGLQCSELLLHRVESAPMLAYYTLLLANKARDRFDCPWIGEHRTMAESPCRVVGVGRQPSLDCHHLTAFARRWQHGVSRLYRRVVSVGDSQQLDAIGPQHCRRCLDVAERLGVARPLNELDARPAEELRSVGNLECDSIEKTKV